MIVSRRSPLREFPLASPRLAAAQWVAWVPVGGGWADRGRGPGRGRPGRGPVWGTAVHGAVLSRAEGSLHTLTSYLWVTISSRITTNIAKMLCTQPLLPSHLFKHQNFNFDV